jgi:hypothetical protein
MKGKDLIFTLTWSARYQNLFKNPVGCQGKNCPDLYVHHASNTTIFTLSCHKMHRMIIIRKCPPASREAKAVDNVAGMSIYH